MPQPDILVLLKRIQDELRSLAARVSILEQRANGNGGRLR